MARREAVAIHVVRAGLFEVGRTDRAGDVVARLTSGGIERPARVYVLDEGRRLAGVVPLAAVLDAPTDTVMGDLAHETRATPANAPRELVARLAVHEGLEEVPVLGPDGAFEGVVPPRALMEALHREHVEDLHRLAGVQREPAEVSLDEPAARKAQHRLPWLLVGLLGTFVATGVMSSYEQALGLDVRIAYFVPGIVYLADAIGTQTEAITVRTLSLTRLPLASALPSEMATGALIGVVLGLLSVPAVWWAWDDSRLAITVGSSIAIAGTIATSMGLLLPWLLARLGRDPAFGSGPVATVLQDLASIIIYFVMADLLLI